MKDLGGCAVEDFGARFHSVASFPYEEGKGLRSSPLGWSAKSGELGGWLEGLPA